jgi:hypothetical protein
VVLGTLLALVPNQQPVFALRAAAGRVPAMGSPAPAHVSVHRYESPHE